MVRKKIKVGAARYKGAAEYQEGVRYKEAAEYKDAARDKVEAASYKRRGDNGQKQSARLNAHDGG